MTSSTVLCVTPKNRRIKRMGMPTAWGYMKSVVICYGRGWSRYGKLNSL